MRAALRERGEISNRDYTAEARTRVDDYRGRKDSSLALHYLWRIGDAMVTRRERFERVYAPTEAVAPADLIRESTDEEADDFLLTKMVAWGGADPAERDQPGPQADRARRRRSRPGGRAASPTGRWSRSAPRAGPGPSSRSVPTRTCSATSTRGSCPRPGRRSRRPATRRSSGWRRWTRSARAAGRRPSSASTTRGRSTPRSTSAAGDRTRCRSCGATGSWPAWTRGWTGRPARS